MRQQAKKASGIPNIALSDFIAPKSTKINDYIGAFCVTTGFGCHEKAREFENLNDDYNSIMIKALADRLAEAFAEYLHKEVRISKWGYSSKENLDNDSLIKEKYTGIRPAPGYPACPDHLEKKSIWSLLSVEESIGVKLTENLAMWPAASVSGYYFSNPNSKYFGLGKIKEDQLLEYSNRKNISFKYGKGSYLYSTENKKYLDFVQGIAVNSLGHAHPKLVKTIKDQSKKLWHVSNAFQIPEGETLAKKLCKKTFADYVMFQNSGAEATEAAIKVARRYFYSIGTVSYTHLTLPTKA